MMISNRVERIEQAVDARLSELTRPADRLERDYDSLRRVADYAGFPVPSKDEMVSQWRDHDRQCARLMLATECTVAEAAIGVYLEAANHAETEERTRAVLDELNELREAVRLDMESGKPGDQSEAGKRLAMLMQ